MKQVAECLGKERVSATYPRKMMYRIISHGFTDELRWRSDVSLRALHFVCENERVQRRSRVH